MSTGGSDEIKNHKSIASVHKTPKCVSIEDGCILTEDEMLPESGMKEPPKIRKLFINIQQIPFSEGDPASILGDKIPEKGTGKNPVRRANYAARRDEG